MFRVLAKNCGLAESEARSVRQFERWTDALYHAKSLIPQCKSLFEDIRIFYGEDLIWIYSRSHKYSQYVK